MIYFTQRKKLQLVFYSSFLFTLASPFLFGMRNQVSIEEQIRSLTNEVIKNKTPNIEASLERLVSLLNSVTHPMNNLNLSQLIIDNIDKIPEETSDLVVNTLIPFIEKYSEISWNNGNFLPIHSLSQKNINNLKKESQTKLYTCFANTINEYTKVGHTPLNFAIMNNNKENVKLLLHHGALPDLPMNDGLTPLYHIILKNKTINNDHLDIINYLLQYKANIYIEVNQSTFQELIREHEDRAKFFQILSYISHNYTYEEPINQKTGFYTELRNICSKNTRNQIPLNILLPTVYAIFGDQFYQLTYDNEETLLHLAANHNNEAFATALINLTTIFRPKSISHQSFFEKKNNKGFTALHLAITKGNLRTAKVIFDGISGYLNMHNANYEGETILHTLIKNQQDNNHFEEAKSFIQYILSTKIKIKYYLTQDLFNLIESYKNKFITQDYSDFLHFTKELIIQYYPQNILVHDTQKSTTPQPLDFAQFDVYEYLRDNSVSNLIEMFNLKEYPNHHQSIHCPTGDLLSEIISHCIQKKDAEGLKLLEEILNIIQKEKPLFINLVKGNRSPFNLIMSIPSYITESNISFLQKVIETQKYHLNYIIDFPLITTAQCIKKAIEDNNNNRLAYLKKLLETLLINGANPNKPNPGGSTPLSLIIESATKLQQSNLQNRLYEIIQLLITHGADRNAYAIFEKTPDNSERYTPGSIHFPKEEFIHTANTFSTQAINSFSFPKLGEIISIFNQKPNKKLSLIDLFNIKDENEFERIIFQMISYNPYIRNLFILPSYGNDLNNLITKLYNNDYTEQHYELQYLIKLALDYNCSAFIFFLDKYKITITGTQNYNAFFPMTLIGILCAWQNENKDNALQIAIKNNYDDRTIISLTNLFLTSAYYEINVNTVNEEGDTVLHLAAKHQRTIFFDEILNHNNANTFYFHIKNNENKKAIDYFNKNTPIYKKLNLVMQEQIKSETYKTYFEKVFTNLLHSIVSNNLILFLQELINNYQVSQAPELFILKDAIQSKKLPPAIITSLINLYEKKHNENIKKIIKNQKEQESLIENLFTIMQKWEDQRDETFLLIQKMVDKFENNLNRENLFTKAFGTPYYKLLSMFYDETHKIHPVYLLNIIKAMAENNIHNYYTQKEAFFYDMLIKKILKDNSKETKGQDRLKMALSNINYYINHISFDPPATVHNSINHIRSYIN